MYTALGTLLPRWTGGSLSSGKPRLYCTGCGSTMARLSFPGAEDSLDPCTQVPDNSRPQFSCGRQDVNVMTNTESEKP